ncbi:hypothetical protein DUNSADRAFT_8680 [Dunaliella salina]|uniref:Uncharacterized protein n=1 Tax=Dunaliella salina TaxID=3046 RepID=A0ABQ7GJ14_DUNSA|nr:hypothetical protein DUNSADRAFT_8680 [Dunaliella salina]|eukprot:KAF5834597.1 hypothetical protein DUNSADRAFT_8680 [Dunaliella salina]
MVTTRRNTRLQAAAQQAAADHENAMHAATQREEQYGYQPPSNTKALDKQLAAGLNIGEVYTFWYDNGPPGGTIVDLEIRGFSEDGQEITVREGTRSFDYEIYLGYEGLYGQGSGHDIMYLFLD